MSMLISLSLDVAQLRTTPMTVGKNGKQYMEITVSVSDQQNQYGKDVSAWQKQSKEETSAKADKKYVGGGTVFWKSQPQQNHQQQQQNNFAPPPPQQQYRAPQAPSAPMFDEPELTF